ncbi:hypothetical protein EDC96DRAFT_503547, partial [Choanephora cucurbitarum]
MLLLFPSEIIDHISQFLTQSEYAQLILVNRACYNRFIIPLHKQIEFDDEYQLGEFLQVSKYHQYIQDLKLRIRYISKASIPNFETAFPIWVSRGYEGKPFYSTSPLLPFRDLKTLTLTDCGDYPTVVDIVIHMPNLTHLTVETMDEFDISVGLLDSILQTCPHLEYLDIAAHVAKVPKEAQLSSSQSFDKLKSLALRLTSGPSHHELFNRSYIGFSPVHLWLQYVANRFSSLESLTFEAHSVRKDEPHTASFYSWLHSQCPSLRYFEWHNVFPDDVFIESLSEQQRQLQQFRLTDEYLIERYIIGALPPYTYLSNILNLEIEVPSEMECNVLLAILGKTCPRLKQLEMYQPSTHDKEPLYLNYLLDLFPCLTTVCLRRVALDVKQTEAIRQTHPLNKLHLQNCYLSTHVFDYLSPCCLNLQYLVLENIVYRDQEYMVKIHLPYQQLIEVDIQYIRIEPDNFDSFIQLFHIKQNDTSYWHLIKQYDEETGQTLSRQQLNETDMKEFDTTLSQLRTVWLEPDYQSGRYATSPPSVFGNWDLCKMIEKGYVDLECQSVRSVYINDKPYDDFFLSL